MGTRALVSVPRLAVVTVLLPFAALLLCIVLSLLLHHSASTATHCRVHNFYPSLSSAIGKFAPQKFIWRAMLALHLAPRLLLGLLYWHRLGAEKWAPLCSALYLVELTGLTCVSFVGSREHYALHRAGFVAFIGGGQSHMVMLTWLLARGRAKMTQPQRHAHQWRCRLLTPNLLCVGNAMYMFVRHNWYCESGVYSIFAILETFIVLINMAFHLTSYWDFGNLTLCVVEDQSSHQS